MDQDESQNALHLTARFTRAVDYARQVDINCRKATLVPYMAHLLGVASLVMGENGYVPFPVTEDMGSPRSSMMPQKTRVGGRDFTTLRRTSVQKCAGSWQDARTALKKTQPRKSNQSSGWLTRTFSHIELAPIFTAESGRPVNALTGLDSNQSHAFPLSGRPLDLERNSLQTPAIVTMDLRVLKYIPFGGVRRLDLVAEAFNLFNRPNVAQINPVFGSNLTPIAGFGQPIEGTGARQIQFSLDFEF
jgi:hypothetical protein